MYTKPFGHWFPQDVDRSRPAVEGDLVAWDFKPWRVVKIRPDNQRDGDKDGTKYNIWVLRAPDAEQWKNTDGSDIHLRSQEYARFDVLREHYGLCVHCNELLPCRSIMAERQTKREMDYMKRFENPAVCPNCQQTVTGRMASETFENVVVPLGPPVTYHAGRRGCRIAMQQYKERIASDDAQLRFDSDGIAD